MIDLLPTYLLYPAAALVAAIISLYAVKKIIFITNHRRIFDIPDNIRKIHGAEIPSLGGIGIFVGYIVVVAFFMHVEWYYVMASSAILFFTGIYDDIMNMRPSKKLLAQLIAAAIPVIFADVRITSLYGIAGIWDLPYGMSVGFTIFCCTFFINVFNFMDGIDGLACVLAMLYTGIMGVLFASMGQIALAGISFSLMGATSGLLFYNIAPAKIYMGDTGSMFLGFTIFILSVLCVNIYSAGIAISNTPLIHSAQAATMLILSVLFIPIYDAIRVFVLRAMKKKSPLHADRTHLHYYLLDAGFSHTRAVLFIGIANVLLVLFIWMLQDIHPRLLLLSMTLATSLMMYVVHIMRQRNIRKNA